VSSESHIDGRAVTADDPCSTWTRPQQPLIREARRTQENGGLAVAG
jgi:hypothetical protein